MAKYVKSALVIAKTPAGDRYIYQGGTVPEDVPAAEVKRLFDEGFLGDTDVDDPDSDGAKPREQWTVDQLKAYAEQHSIDLGDAKVKADILAAIELAES